MQNDPLKDYWKAWGFVNSYKTLDQNWQTKLALYREAMTTAASLKPFHQRTSVIDLGGGLGTLSTIAANDFGDSPFGLWTVCDSSFEMMTRGLAFQLQDKVQDEKSTYFVQADIQKKLTLRNLAFLLDISCN